MSRRQLSTYRKLATSRGYPDPLKYLFSRLKAKIAEGDHKGAEIIAKELLPYGHGKIAPVDQESGATVQAAVFVLD